MFDGSQDTCWNSDQGTPQYIIIELSRPLVVKQIKIMFQGGFVGQEGYHINLF